MKKISSILVFMILIVCNVNAQQDYVYFGYPLELNMCKLGFHYRPNPEEEGEWRETDLKNLMKFIFFRDTVYIIHEDFKIDKEPIVLLKEDWGAREKNYSRDYIILKSPFVYLGHQMYYTFSELYIEDDKVGYYMIDGGVYQAFWMFVKSETTIPTYKYVGKTVYRP